MNDQKKGRKREILTDIDIEIRSPAARAVLLGVLVFIILAFTGYQFYAVYGGRPDVKTQTAIYQTVSRNVSSQAFIIRNEEYVNNPYQGTVVPAVSNGRKVGIGDTVARIFPTEAEAGNYSRIEIIDEDLEYYRSVDLAGSGTIPADLTLYNNNVLESLLALSDAAQDDELSRLPELSGELREVITKKQIACGEKVDVSAQVEELTNEKSSLEASVSAYSSVVSDKAGYYISSADGYENAVDFSSVKELSYADVEKLNSAEPEAVPSGIVGKLVTEFNWYLVCNVQNSAISGIETGDAVKVSFPNAFVNDLNMYVAAINSEGSDSNVTMILRSNKMDAAVASLRKEQVRIRAEEYSGYVVDPKAVRTVDGVTGVFVRLGNIVRFRKIDIAYSDEDMILATCPDGENGYLKQYDEIIIEGKDLYDGKNIS